MSPYLRILIMIAGLVAMFVIFVTPGTQTSLGLAVFFSFTAAAFIGDGGNKLLMAMYSVFALIMFAFVLSGGT